MEVSDALATRCLPTLQGVQGRGYESPFPFGLRELGVRVCRTSWACANRESDANGCSHRVICRGFLGRAPALCACKELSRREDVTICKSATEPSPTQKAAAGRSRQFSNAKLHTRRAAREYCGRLT
eukprot:scaffold28661_cov33-Tisochrysis_lutea.AAC.2